MPVSEPSPTVLIVEHRAEFASLLAAVLETAGLQARIAGSAKEARRIIEELPPDALALELLLPDAFGYEVAKAFRRARPESPVIAFSEAFGEDPSVREAMNIGLFDVFLKKPLRFARVVEELEVRLDWKGRTGEDSPGEPTDDPARELAADSLGPHSPGFALDSPESGLVMATIEAIEARDEKQWVGDGPPGQEIEVDSQGLWSGDLKDRGVPRLINAFYLGGQSGELILRFDGKVKMVYFRKGIPVFAASNLREDRFDVRVRATNEVTVEALDRALDESLRCGKRIDQILLESGALTKSRHKSLVTEQVKAIIFRLFSVREGTWRITLHDRAELEPVRLDIHPADLILEGVSSLSSETLEQLLPKDTCLAPSPTPPYELYQLSISGPQAMIISRLDGTRSVADIAEEGWLPEKETHSFLYGLYCLEVVDDAGLMLL